MLAPHPSQRTTSDRTTSPFRAVDRDVIERASNRREMSQKPRPTQRPSAREFPNERHTTGRRSFAVLRGQIMTCQQPMAMVPLLRIECCCRADTAVDTAATPDPSSSGQRDKPYRHS